jgi:hypothetical protein
MRLSIRSHRRPFRLGLALYAWGATVSWRGFTRAYGPRYGTYDCY